MGKNLRPLVRTLIILLVPLGVFGSTFFKTNPTTNFEFILRADLGDLLRDMAGYNPDSLFNAAISQADSISDADGGNFMDEMTKIYSSNNAKGKLAPVFASWPRYANVIHRSDPNEKALECMNSELRKEFYAVFTTLKVRISQFDSTLHMKADYTSGEIVIDVNSHDQADISRFRKLLITRGKLEFWNTYENEELIDNIVEADKALGKQMMINGGNDSSKLNPILKILHLRLGDKNVPTSGACVGISFGRDTARVDEYLGMDAAKKLFPKDVKFIWRAKPINDKFYELFAIKTNPFLMGAGAPLNGDVITDAIQGFDQNGIPDVTLTMNAQGSVKWERMTDEAANSSIRKGNQVKDVRRCIAIVLDDRVFVAPRVQSKILGGKTVVTGVGDLLEATDLANILKSGVIKCRLKIISEGRAPDAKGK
jgi:SecD/SecF fusion protein